jgi:hypothetical protein
LEFICYFFWMRRKLSFLDEPEFSDQVIFLLTRKNSKKIKKIYKFWITNRF